MTQVFLELDHERPERLSPERGEAVLFSSKAYDKTTGNEDAALFCELPGAVTVLAVADGVGGLPAGAEAAATAIGAVRRAVERTVERSDRVADRSVDREPIARPGARCARPSSTPSRTPTRGCSSRASARRRPSSSSRSAETSRAPITPATPGRCSSASAGRVRFETIPHSPVGYGVAAGMLEPSQTHHHDERHLLSNCVGSREMRVEIGAPVTMAARDTLLLATDGVLENIERRNLIDQIRIGSLLQAATDLQARLRLTMAGVDPKLPAHPDDATALLFRTAADRLRGPVGIRLKASSGERGARR
jgi:serine/threonine protein phosphatase PrpC